MNASDTCRTFFGFSLHSFPSVSTGFLVLTPPSPPASNNKGGILKKLTNESMVNEAFTAVEIKEDKKMFSSECLY